MLLTKAVCLNNRIFLGKTHSEIIFSLLHFGINPFYPTKAKLGFINDKGLFLSKDFVWGEDTYSY